VRAVDDGDRPRGGLGGHVDGVERDPGNVGHRAGDGETVRQCQDGLHLLGGALGFGS
jgi:hypothetical protein